MPFALKLQATKGEITAFDCTGGEPDDQHRTILESDPADERVVEVLSMTLGEAVAELGEATLVGDLVNRALEILDPSDLVGNAVKDILDALAPGQFRFQLRKMDSDGKD